jgi:ubiquinone/menaquinone biosynthesis C-methylase UbiE
MSLDVFNIKKINLNFKDTYWNSDAALTFFAADNPERAIIQPKIAEEVLKTNPSRLLDYGCGDGFISTLLPDTIKIDLFDKNSTLLDETINKLNKPNCLKISSDDEIKENTYDCIILSFVLVCIETKEEQERILKLLYKSLKNGGKLIITNSHPCFLQYPNSSFHTSFSPKCFNYLNSGEPYVVNIHQGQQEQNLSFVDYKWTLSFWINIAYKCKFTLEKMIEVKDEKYQDLVQNKLYPPFLILKYSK